MTTLTRETIIRPGLFGDNCAADSRRLEFDYCNESLLMAGVRPEFVFIGDSITHLWELQAYFGGTGKILINRGINGDESTNVRRRFEADALQLRPDVIVMMIGTNDLGWEPQVLSDDRPPQVVENITAMTEAALAAKIRMVVCSVLPIWGTVWLENTPDAARKNAQINWINERLQALARHSGAIYVDYHSMMAAPNGELRNELTDDGVHPHSAGYTILAQVLRETLTSHNIVI